MNPLDAKLNIGTLGELLMQIRLLEYSVQSAPPLKDTGNDLIAVREEVFKAIQVKTTTGSRFNLSNLHRCHLIAFVVLVGEGNHLHLDQCRIFLLPRSQVEEGQQTIGVRDLAGREL